jgi:hypothetical protein
MVSRKWLSSSKIQLTCRTTGIYVSLFIMNFVYMTSRREVRNDTRLISKVLLLYHDHEVLTKYSNLIVSFFISAILLGPHSDVHACYPS